ncbi:NUDIX domain-containing protein [Candidatus Dependentiae bacterium]
MNSNEEILDLVSQDDIVIGKAPRNEIYAKKMRNYRAVNAFLINQFNEVWIPTRHPNKVLFPMCLDYSVSGHVSTGETYEEAFFRETLEELNIYLSSEKFEQIAHLTPCKNQTHCFSKLYVIYSSKTPNYNKSDFVSAEWLKPENALKKMYTGEKHKGDLPRHLEILIQFMKKK